MGSPALKNKITIIKLPLVVFLSQQCKEEDQTLAKHHDVNAAQFADKKKLFASI